MKEIDFDSIKDFGIAERKSLVKAGDVGRLPDNPEQIAKLLDSLPDAYAANDLRALITAIKGARDDGKAVIFAIGGHVVKTGCAPYLIDLINRGYITGIASNGSVLIHDYELGAFGYTSEDVAESLPEGKFGLARETAITLNGAAQQAVATERPVAHIIGDNIAETGKHPDISLLAACAKSDTLFTAHIALGADVIHQHPTCDGAAWGAATMADFRRLTASLKGLDSGGVYINLGSAVIMPEVFLKALNLIRNINPPVKDFTTANLDMIQHYRPRTNVLARPVSDGGRALAITGQHEILVPLLWAGVTGR
jgi:hypothetical protein